jgi:hypothetical protein
VAPATCRDLARRGLPRKSSGCSSIEPNTRGVISTSTCEKEAVATSRRRGAAKKEGVEERPLSDKFDPKADCPLAADTVEKVGVAVGLKS